MAMKQSKWNSEQLTSWMISNHSKSKETAQNLTPNKTRESQKKIMNNKAIIIEDINQNENED